MSHRRQKNTLHGEQRGINPSMKTKCSSEEEESVWAGVIVGLRPMSNHTPVTVAHQASSLSLGPINKNLQNLITSSPSAHTTHTAAYLGFLKKKTSRAQRSRWLMATKNRSPARPREWESCRHTNTSTDTHWGPPTDPSGASSQK